VDGFDWREFLDLAAELGRRRGDPSAQRTAISRASGPAFHQAAAYVVQRGQRRALTGQDHSLVWDWFQRPGADRRSSRIGSDGVWLRRLRRRADDDPSPWTSLITDAATAVSVARGLAGALS